MFQYKLFTTRRSKSKQIYYVYLQYKINTAKFDRIFWVVLFFIALGRFLFYFIGDME